MSFAQVLDFTKKIIDVLIVWFVLYYVLKSLRKNVKMVLLFKGIRYNEQCRLLFGIY